MSGLLEIRNLRVHFPIGGGLFSKPKLLRALNGISLDVQEGEVLSIVGESGCGKSTLANAILGIQKPTSGKVLFEGKEIHHQRRRDIAERIQPIFQDPQSALNPRKTVKDLIAMPLRVRGAHSAKEIGRTVDEIMELVGLPQRLGHSYPTALSGGQRQRIAIGRALVTRPKLIVCDEPTSALDVSIQAQILNLLADLRAELNLTYVFISHDLSVVRHISDRVAVIYLGRIVELGPADDLLDDPLHPYTRKLRSAHLSTAPHQELPKPVFKGGFPDPTNPPLGCHFHPRCFDALEVCETHVPGSVRRGRSDVACHLYTGLGTPGDDMTEIRRTGSTEEE
ncbi:ABC transporter ATP-binding protein [Sinisalibacter aestuarii]|uniref:ABC transporter ATP-binding protein n=1 Tax=Sinisalibacter aestuarii TaxID=2949426 RepID=A0ABQ5LYU6_9RHOB|nr:ABC transporter ATP-binding protein [Sinisalibacter aestuarii]GKY89938.1 ABC transporter ATP-binding protein [Sinisalibacter aestuarii]